MEKRTFVAYEDFGAIGDGKHDDMPAIVAAHNYANEQGLDVRAKDGAEYLIGGKDLTAVIKTNTNFGNAKFIVYDVELENINASIFRVVTDSKIFAPEIKSVKKNQKHIDFPHEGTVYVRVYKEEKIYIRKGLNQNSGNDATDCFVVDGDGNILSGINWDYDNISKAYAFSVNDTPIVIEGGTFITVANQMESKYTYHSRNIVITRSNVTVRNLTHLIEGELDHGAPYAGFLTVSESYNVTLKDCLLTPHKTYYTESQIPGQMVGMGTYDMSVRAAIGAKLINIKQSRPIVDSIYWGLMGSNFCKNLYLENCSISRFDAHCGVTGCTIKNCELGGSGLQLIGFDEFLVENTLINGYNFINFRSDYGSFFDGKLTVKNCTWHPRNVECRNEYCIFGQSNTGDHYFGYECGLPRELIVDGLTIDDADGPENSTTYLFSDYDTSYAPNKPYAYRLPDTITVNNISTKKGKKVTLAPSPEQFPGFEDLKIN